MPLQPDEAQDRSEPNCHLAFSGCITNGESQHFTSSTYLLMLTQKNTNPNQFKKQYIIWLPVCKILDLRFKYDRTEKISVVMSHVCLLQNKTRYSKDTLH